MHAFKGFFQDAIIEHSATQYHSSTSVANYEVVNKDCLCTLSVIKIMFSREQQF